MLIAISDQSQIASARRSAEARARSLGFGETRTGRVALIATEMASNILKHAAHGHLTVTQFDDSTGRGLEVLALDKGPGIDDVARSMEDGYSTVGTPGTGLGAIRRQADIFDIYSRPGAGAVVMARVFGEDGAPRADTDGELGVVVIPYPGEFECGDSLGFWHQERCPEPLRS